MRKNGAASTESNDGVRQSSQASSRGVWSVVAVAAVLGAQYHCVHVMLASPAQPPNWFSVGAVLAAVGLVLATVVGSSLIFLCLGSRSWAGWAVATVALEATVAWEMLAHVSSRHGDARFIVCAVVVVLCAGLAAWRSDRNRRQYRLLR